MAFCQYALSAEKHLRLITNSILFQTTPTYPNKKNISCLVKKISYYARFYLNRFQFLPFFSHFKNLARISLFPRHPTNLSPGEYYATLHFQQQRHPRFRPKHLKVQKMGNRTSRQARHLATH